MIIFLFSIFILIFPNACFGQHICNFARNNSPLFSNFAMVQEENEVWESDTVIVDKKIYHRDTLGLKSPLAAVFLAVAPGFLFRGSGHFYAGYYKTGIALLGTEAASIGMLYLAFGMSFGDEKSQVAASMFGWMSLICFFGSWAYDIIGSPILIMRNNKKAIEGLSVQPYFYNRRSAEVLGLSFRYNF